MVQYIDKAAVVAEIEARYNECLKRAKINDAEYWNGKADAYRDMLVVLDTLEVKEVKFEDGKSIFEGQYLSKDKVVTTIEKLQDECEEQDDNNGVELLEKLFNKLDSLEVKEVVAEQEGVCNNIFNRIIGDNWNLSIPLDKAGLKHGDKVKIFITKEK